MATVVGEAGRVGAGSSGRKKLHMNKIALQKQVYFGVGGHFTRYGKLGLFQGELRLIERQQHEVEEILCRLKLKSVEKPKCPAVKSSNHQRFARCMRIDGRSAFPQCVMVYSVEPGSREMCNASARQCLSYPVGNRVNYIGI